MVHGNINTGRVLQRVPLAEAVPRVKYDCLDTLRCAWLRRTPVST